MFFNLRKSASSAGNKKAPAESADMHRIELTNTKLIKYD
jgi:hypothetical protein